MPLGEFSEALHLGEGLSLKPYNVPDPNDASLNQVGSRTVERRAAPIDGLILLGKGSEANVAYGSN